MQCLHPNCVQSKAKTAPVLQGFLDKTQTQKKKVHKIWKQEEVTERDMEALFESVQLGKLKPTWN